MNSAFKMFLCSGRSLLPHCSHPSRALTAPQSTPPQQSQSPPGRKHLMTSSFRGVLREALGPPAPFPASCVLPGLPLGLHWQPHMSGCRPPQPTPFLWPPLLCETTPWLAPLLCPAAFAGPLSHICHLLLRLTHFLCHQLHWGSAVPFFAGCLWSELNPFIGVGSLPLCGKGDDFTEYFKWDLKIWERTFH